MCDHMSSKVFRDSMLELTVFPWNFGNTLVISVLFQLLSP